MAPEQEEQENANYNYVFCYSEIVVKMDHLSPAERQKTNRTTEKKFPKPVLITTLFIP